LEKSVVLLKIDFFKEKVIRYLTPEVAEQSDWGKDTAMLLKLVIMYL
jgi:hypothetical protein